MVAVMMCMSLNLHSLPAVVVGRPGTAERQLRHIVLTHSNELTGYGIRPPTVQWHPLGTVQ